MPASDQTLSTIVIGLFTALTTFAVLYLIARGSTTTHDDDADQ